MTITYHIDLEEDPDRGGYTATIRELPGLVTEDETVPATLRRLGDALTSWVDACGHSGVAVPVPDPDD